MISIINPLVKTYYIAIRGGVATGCGSVTSETRVDSGADELLQYTDRDAYIAALTGFFGADKVNEFLHGPTPVPPSPPLVNPPTLG